MLNQATTGYTVGDDRKSITITPDEASGSYIRVKYNQYYNVAVDDIRQSKIFGGDISQPKTAVDLTLRTLTPIEKVD